MPHERRLAAYAAVGLFLTMFLPWYQRQFFIIVGGKLQPGSDSQTAWAQFSFVEAAVLLVAAGVLTLLFQRAEGKAFHLPGGDGWVITAAGFWTSLLIVWRIFDKQGGSAHGQNATTYGIEWGIVVALVVAAFLAYAGSRIRAAHQPEPPLPGEDDERAPRVEERPARSAPPRPQRRETGWLSAPPRDRLPDHPPRDREPQHPPPDREPQHPPHDREPEYPPRRCRSTARSVGSPPEWSGDPAPEFPGRSRPPRRIDDFTAETQPRAPKSLEPSEPRSARAPKPVPADEPPTAVPSDGPIIRDARRRDPDGPTIAPSTPAARRAQQSDEQMTIPLERDEP